MHCQSEPFIFYLRMIFRFRFVPTTLLRQRNNLQLRLWCGDIGYSLEQYIQNFRQSNLFILN